MLLSIHVVVDSLNMADQMECSYIWGLNSGFFGSLNMSNIRLFECLLEFLNQVVIDLLDIVDVLELV